MNRSAWSSLLIGTMLATVATAPLRAETAPDAATAERAIDRIAASDETSRAEADTTLFTGSILPLDKPLGGLSPLGTRAGGQLKELREAAPAEPAPRKPVATAEPAKTEAVAPEPMKAEAAAPEPAKAEAVAPEPMKAETVAPATAANPAEAEIRPAVASSDATVPAVPADTAVVSPSPAPTTEAPVAAGSTPDAGAQPGPKAEAEPTVKSDAAPIATAATTAPTTAPATAAPDTAPEGSGVAALETRPVEAPSAAPTAKAEAPIASVTTSEAPAKAEPAPTRVVMTTASEPKPVEIKSAEVKPTDARPTEVKPAGAPTLTPREDDVAAAHAAQVGAEALKKVLEAHAVEAGSADDKRDRAAIVAFYAARAHAPLLMAGDDLSPKGRAVVEQLRTAALDGLEPRDYALPQRAATTPEARAEIEYALAMTALRYARHIASGRFEPSRLSDLVTPKPPKPDSARVLAEIAEAGDVAGALAAWAPPHPGYKRLKAELARLRGEVEVPVVRLPPGPVLKPGARDARVAMLRERLGASAGPVPAGATANDAADVYDAPLADMVKAFQRERGLSANGSLNRETVAALNDESRGNGDKIADVIANMERWRWLPRELGDLHVFVNIPDFHLDVMKAGVSIHHARVVTGRPENQTPIFSETMKYVVVNPYWHVPQSIIQKEMLGKLQAGHGLSRSFEVEVGNRTVDPSTVDWTQVSARQVSIRQRPGDGNALGNIKFMFPNQHSVYIHDTSSRSLFANSYRALSHGCVRVHEPFSFADAVLSQEKNLGGAQLKKQIGGAEKEIQLERQVPVHINYFTVWVDDAGQVQTRRDVYGHDAKVKKILGL